MALTDPRKRSLGSGPSAGGGAPGAGVSAPAAGGAAPAPAAPQKQGTGFVNLSDILAANRTGAQQMGQQLTSQVATQGQQAQTGIASAKNVFQSAVRAGTPGFNENAQTSRGDTSAGAARGYTGPTTWAENAELTTQTNRAQDSAQALGTQGGRAALLRESNPGLTAGGASMDAFLAGVGGGQALRDTSAQYSNISAMLAEARGEAPATVADAERTAAANQQRYVDQQAAWDAAETASQRSPSLADPSDDPDARRSRNRNPNVRSP